VLYILLLRHLVTPIRYGCGPLLLNFPTELTCHSRAYGARSVAPANSGALSASPRPRVALANLPQWPSVGYKDAKYHIYADLLKTVAMHKEQRTDRQTDRHADTFGFIHEYLILNVWHILSCLITPNQQTRNSNENWDIIRQWWYPTVA